MTEGEIQGRVVHNLDRHDTSPPVLVCVSTPRFQVRTSQGPVESDYLVNAAGMHAPFLAGNMAFYPRSAIPPVYFAKGNYFKLQGVRAPFRRLIYPIPAAGGLGVHATLDMQGRVKFGPNVEWLRRPGYSPGQSGPGDAYRFPVDAPPPTDFRVSHRCTEMGEGGLETETDTAEVFCREVARYWPAVQRDMLAPDYAGIRPKLCGPAPAPPSPSSASLSSSSSGAVGVPVSVPVGVGAGTETAAETAAGDKTAGEGTAAYHMPASADFAILGSAAHHIPGLVCVFGAESPGLTSSLAIARHVRDLLLQSPASGQHRDE